MRPTVEWTWLSSESSMSPRVQPASLAGHRQIGGEAEQGDGQLGHPLIDLGLTLDQQTERCSSPRPWLRRSLRHVVRPSGGCSDGVLRPSPL